MKYNSNRYFENMLGYYKYIVCDGNLSNYKIDKFKKFLNGFDLKFGSIKYNEEKDRIDMKLELENSNINYYYNDTFIDKSGNLNMNLFFGLEPNKKINVNSNGREIDIGIILLEKGIYYMKYYSNNNNPYVIYLYYDKDTLDKILSYTYDYVNFISHNDTNLRNLGFLPDCDFKENIKDEDYDSVIKNLSYSYLDSVVDKVNSELGEENNHKNEFVLKLK